MLKIMREQAGSFFIKIILGAITIVFIFWGVGSFNPNRLVKVAEVDGQIISAKDYQAAYNRLVDQYRRYGMNIDEKMVERLKEQALDQLIDRQLMLQEAERLNIKVSDAELAENIQEMSVFQTEGGAFDKNLYTRVLGANRMNPEEFEASHREDLMLRKMTGLIRNGVKVSEAEIQEWYDWKKALVKIDYAFFDPKVYGDIEPTDDEIQAYYDANQASYKTEPERKAQYVKFAIDQYTPEITVSKEDVDAYYNEHPDEFKEEKKVSARHILFKVDEKASEEAKAEKRKKAEEVLAEVREKPDQFAELAKQYSEGPTQSKGGDLGEFGKGRMVAPFEEKAFSMAEGEISDLVKTRFGWHIIKVEKVNEEKVFPLEESREKIEKDIKEALAKSKAFDSADNFFRDAPEDENFSDLAASRNIEVKETGRFTRNKGPEGVKDSRRFASKAFGLKVMQISEPVEQEDGYLIVQVLEDIPAETKPLETVREDVRKDWIRSRQDETAKTKATEFLEAWTSDADMTEAAKTYAVEIKETDFFERSGNIPGIGFNAQISKAAFELNPEKRFPDAPIKASSGDYVIQFKARKSPDEKGLEKERDGIRDQLTQQKQMQAVQEWVDGLKKKSKIIKETDTI